MSCRGPPNSLAAWKLNDLSWTAQSLGRQLNEASSSLRKRDYYSLNNPRNSSDPDSLCPLSKNRVVSGVVDYTQGTMWWLCKLCPLNPIKGLLLLKWNFWGLKVWCLLVSRDKWTEIESVEKMGTELVGGAMTRAEVETEWSQQVASGTKVILESKQVSHRAVAIPPTSSNRSWSWCGMGGKPLPWSVLLTRTTAFVPSVLPSSALEYTRKTMNLNESIGYSKSLPSQVHSYFIEDSLWN